MGKTRAGVLLANNPTIQLSNSPFQMAGPLELLRVQGFEMACQAVARDAEGTARLRTACYGAAAFARSCVASEGWYARPVTLRIQALI